jgi:DNA-binding transcriptional MerR regulator
MDELSVGEVARIFGISVRTLHHYDEVGLLVPQARSLAGYRLYSAADLERLATIVTYRRLGMPLDAIGEILAGDAPLVDHLRRQQASVAERLNELADLARAIDDALERTMTNTPATPEDLKKLFGESYSEERQEEAQQTWGHTDAWRQSASRTKRYTASDWAAMKAESEQVNAAFAAALAAGMPADSPDALAAAEAHRRHIEAWFYDLDHSFHRGLADMYLADPRFTKTYEDIAPGLAAYVHDAIHANADARHGTEGY